MKDRIRQLMEAQHMTQQTFAELTGINPGSLSGIFNNRTKPTLNMVEAIRSKFPNVNIDWLMFGNGTMFRSDNNENTPSSTPREQNVGEQSLDFGEHENAPMQQYNAFGNARDTSMSGARSVRNVQTMRTDVLRERETRKITEIRVFYDDQTWESFVPKK